MMNCVKLFIHKDKQRK